MDDNNNREICNPYDCLHLSPDEIYVYFLEYIFPEIEKSGSFVSTLKNSPRYGTDACFKVMVDVMVLAQDYSYQRNESYVTRCKDLLSVARALEQWLLVAQLWLALGNCYLSMNMLERAIECYCSVVEIEKKHHFSTLTQVAYSNLGLAYVSIEYYEKAVINFNKSNEELNAKGLKTRRTEHKKIENYSNLLYCYCKMEDQDKAKESYERLQTFDLTLISDEIRHHYLQIRLLYVFLLYSRSICDFEECEKAFEEAREKINQNHEFHYPRLLYNFVERCFHYEVELTLFEDRVNEFLGLYPSSFEMINYAIAEQAINYYELKGEEDRLPRLYKNFSEYVLKLVEQNRMSQRSSVDIVEALLINKPESDEMSSENYELKMLYRESTEAKTRLKEAYERIELINELGRKLTSTIDLNELIQAINEILKNQLDFDCFLLLMTDSEKGVLSSLIFEYNGELQSNIEIPLDAKESFSARCYRTHKPLRIDGKMGQNLVRIPLKDGVDMCSAVYLPLIVNQSVIGVYTLQHRDQDVYRDKMNFLTDLTPYISIAVNNALKSRSLEKEIESHIITQSKLREANLNLEKLSLVDGLTHISSRRFFEKKVQEMLGLAEEKGSSFTMLMIDIDNFKMYNDTYGHLEGDKALQAVASVFKEEMEKVNGLSARFGGEEFVGACLGLSLEESASLGDRIRAGVHALQLENKGTALGLLTVSIGLSYGLGLRGDAKSYMMKKADEMLYKAKNSGKNRIMIQNCEDML